MAKIAQAFLGFSRGIPELLVEASISHSTIVARINTSENSQNTQSPGPRCVVWDHARCGPPLSSRFLLRDSAPYASAKLKATPIKKGGRGWVRRGSEGFDVQDRQKNGQTRTYAHMHTLCRSWIFVRVSRRQVNRTSPRDGHTRL